MKSHNKFELVIRAESSRVLLVRPEMAMEFGINEAMIFNQIKYHFMNGHKTKVVKGKIWFVATIKDLKKEFNFMGINTIKRAIYNLEKEGLLIGEFERNGESTQSKRYRLPDELIEMLSNVGAINSTNSYQNILPDWGPNWSKDQSQNRTTQNGTSSVSMTTHFGSSPPLMTTQNGSSSEPTPYSINIYSNKHKDISTKKEIKTCARAGSLNDLIEGEHLPPAVLSFPDNDFKVSEETKAIKKSAKKMSKAEIDELFAQFWNKYPNRVGKIKARAAFERSLGITSGVAILNALEAQKYEREQKDQLGIWQAPPPHPTTWLNQGRWEDEVKTIDQLRKHSTQLVRAADPRGTAAFNQDMEFREMVKRDLDRMEYEHRMKKMNQLAAGAI